MKEFDIKFISNCVKQGEGLETADNKKINKSSSELLKIRKVLLGESKLALLSQFLHHENDYVKYISAMYLLPLKENESINVLKKLSLSKNRTLSSTCEFVLTEWKEGGLDWLRS